MMHETILTNARLVLRDEVIDGEEVARETEASDDAFAGGGGHRFVAEFFALIDV